MKQVKNWVERLYGIQGEMLPLEGYSDQNFKLITQDGATYVVKLSPKHSDLDLDRALTEMLSFLSTHDQKDMLPAPYLSQKGNPLEIVDIQGDKRTLRVLNWIEGSQLKDAKHTPDLFSDIGRCLGQLDRSLVDYKNNYLSQRFSDWDLKHALIIARDSHFIDSPEHRRLAEYFFLQFKEVVLPGIDMLRKGMIHADANDYNILVNNDKVSGLIDFGDAVYTPIVNETAIALAYLLMDKKEPLYWAEQFMKGYNEEFPLEEKEIDILYYLVAARLSMSVTKSAVSKTTHPDNEYLTVSEKQAWDLLKKWIRINPLEFTERMRSVCYMEKADRQSEKELLASRKKHLSSTLSISYGHPIPMYRAALQYMYSTDGSTYLDCVNNICHVGHSHPRVVRAGQGQMAILNTNTRYLYKELNIYAERLASKFPAPLDTVFLVNSGSEAGDLAQRIARTVTGQTNTIVVDHAYHGNTLAGIEASPYKFEGRGGSGKSSHIHKLDIPDGYRGEFKYEDPGAGRKYANQIEDILKFINNKAQGLAAFYCESIIGCGGQIVLPDGYLKAIYDLVRAEGGLCIADEVQVGFGRVGERFWGFELQDVVPDIVVIGKPMGNGHPLAGVVTTRDIAEKFDTGMEYFSSFGGNPVSCAIGLEVLNVIEEEKLQENALETGNYFKDQLLSLSENQYLIGDVRGHGLFLGVELVEDHESLMPATDTTSILIEEIKNQGILLSTDGPFNNVIKIKPPLVFNKQNVDRVVSTLDEVLNKIKER